MDNSHEDGTCLTSGRDDETPSFEDDPHEHLGGKFFMLKLSAITFVVGGVQYLLGE